MSLTARPTLGRSPSPGLAQRRPRRASGSQNFCSKRGTKEKEKDVCGIPKKAHELRVILAKRQKQFRKTKPLCLIIEKKKNSEGNWEATPVPGEGAAWPAEAQRVVPRGSSPQPQGQSSPSRWGRWGRSSRFPAEKTSISGNHPPRRPEGLRPPSPSLGVPGEQGLEGEAKAATVGAPVAFLRLPPLSGALPV